MIVGDNVGVAVHEKLGFCVALHFGVLEIVGVEVSVGNSAVSVIVD